MLLSSKKIVCVFATLVLLLTGCSINEPKQNNEQPVLAGGEGTISVTVPSIKYFLESAKPKKSGSRAILSCDKINIKILKDGKLFDEYKWTQQQGANIYDHISNNSSKIDIKLQPDTYTMEIEVFNPNIEDKPVVRGKSNEFEVISNTIIDVVIVATPVDPTEITIGEEITFNKSDYIATTINEKEEVTTGSEKWYSFTPTTNYTQIDIKSDIDDMSMLVLLYDSKGEIYNLMRDFILPTTPNETYYIGTAYIDFPDGYIGLPFNKDLTSKTITLSPFVDKEDNNDTLETAEEITIGEKKLLAIDKIEDTDFFKVELKAGGKYQLKFNFEDPTIDKTVFSSSSDVISNFTDTNGNKVNKFEYYPEEDETIYVSVTMTPDKFYQNTPPNFHIFNMLESTVHIGIFNNIQIIEGDSIEVKIFDNESEGSITYGYPLKVYQDNLLELVNVKLKDNVTIDCLIKDKSGKIKYASEKKDLNEEKSSHINFNFKSTEIDVEIAESSVLCGINGNEIVLYFKDRNQYYGWQDTLELTLTATFIEVPANSQLLNKKIKLDYNQLAYKHYGFNITTDIPGKYKFKLDATNGYITSSQEYTLYSIEDNEGVLNVTFE